MKARGLSLTAALVLGGCASLLSLDDLKVKEEGAAGASGSSDGTDGGAGASGTGGTGGGSAGTGGIGGTGGVAGDAGVAGGGAGGSAGTGGTGGKGGSSGSSGSSGASGAAGSAGTAGAGGSGPTPLHPPDRPVGDPKPGMGKTLALAARSLYFGVTDPVTKMPDPTAWKRIGYDIDGKCTSAADSSGSMPGTCKRPPSATSDSLTDGDACRDNNFGSKFLVTLVNLKPDVETKLASGIDKGASTLMLVISDLDTTADDTYAPAVLYVVAPWPDDAGIPAWDGKDHRQIDTSSVVNNDITKPLVVFPKGYVKGNTWVSGDFNKTPSVLPFPYNGSILAIPAESLTLTVELSADHASTKASVLSGAIKSSEFVCALKPALLSQFSCNSTFAQPFIDQFVSWADLSAGAPDFLDTTKTCDAMSIGGALEFVPVKVPAPGDVITVPVQPNPCFDGGIPNCFDGGM